jgi:hypothetical protein
MFNFVWNGRHGMVVAPLCTECSKFVWSRRPRMVAISASKEEIIVLAFALTVRIIVRVQEGKSLVQHMHIVLKKFSLKRTNFFSLFVFLVVVDDGVYRMRSGDNELRESGELGEPCGGKSQFSQRVSLLCNDLPSSLGGDDGKPGVVSKDGSHGVVSLKASVNNFMRVLKFYAKSESCSRGFA